MRITVREARKRLAKVGMGLGVASRNQTSSQFQPIYQVTTPLGTTLHMHSSEVLGLLRDLQRTAT
jgi:hypothetical protein